MAQRISQSYGIRLAENSPSSVVLAKSRCLVGKFKE
jgi:hypothetical protein